MSEIDYTTIATPYSSGTLERSSSVSNDGSLTSSDYDEGSNDSVGTSYGELISTIAGSVSGSASENSNTESNGSVAEANVKGPGNFTDVFIDNWIKSTNWSPKKTGFYIDGLKGYAEFCNVYVSGNIKALTGEIGGFIIGADSLSVTEDGNTTILSSGGIAFQAGPTGAPNIVITRDGLLTASDVMLSGTINAESGEIGGFYVDLYDGLYAGDGDTRVQMKPSEGIWAGDNNIENAPFSVSVEGYLTAVYGNIGGFIMNFAEGLFSGEGTERVQMKPSAGFWAGAEVQASAPFSVTNEGVLTSVSGYIGGWIIGTDLLKSADTGVRIELNKGDNRISVFDALNEKVVMGYLEGLPKNDGTGNWGVGDYGFWARSGDKLSIDGDGEYTSGDWIIQNDASYLVHNYNGDTIVRLGTDTGEKGIFIYDLDGDILSKFTSNQIFIGDETQFLRYTNVGGLEVGKINLGTDGMILGGQTDYGTGDGFFLGYSSGYYKMSIGNDNNHIKWNGSNLIIKGAFDVGTNGVINNSSFTVANLPLSPTAVGANNPSGNE